MIQYREAKKCELKRVANLTTETFGEYPIYDLVLRDAFKDKDSYLKYMKKLHYMHIKANAKKHKCLVGILDGKIVSAALIQSPNAARISIFDYILSGAIKLLYPVGIFRLLRFFSVSEEAHADCVKKYPHSWYLELIVVDKSLTGKGIGSKMLNDCITPYILSQKGDSLTLITNTEGNRKFYLKNGFTEFAKSVIERNGRKINNWSYYMNF